MNPVRLLLETGEPTNYYMCGKCRHLKADLAITTQCCAPVICSCGETIADKYYLSCMACRKAASDLKERGRFEKAKRVHEREHYGPVCADVIGYNEGFFENVEALREYIFEDHDTVYDIPYAWAVKETPVYNLSTHSVLEPFEENAYEDFDSYSVTGLDELKKALDIFNEQNKGFRNWDIDYSTAVLLEPMCVEKECPYCESVSDIHFSRVEPMGFICPDCGQDVDADEDELVVLPANDPDPTRGGAYGSGIIDDEHSN
jgi:hypothetical protein